MEHLDYAVSCATSSRPWILITDCDHPEIDVERAVFAAAGLEVRLARCRTEEEVLAAGPDDGDPLLACDQVIITPHVAFYSEESLAELKRRAAQSIIEALARRAVSL